MSQNDTVLSHLRTRGSITTFIAFKRYQITRLAARIGQLERKGHLINHTPISRRGKQYVSYSLVEAAGGLESDRARWPIRPVASEGHRLGRP